jgi:hypothetical protein
MDRSALQQQVWAVAFLVLALTMASYGLGVVAGVFILVNKLVSVLLSFFSSNTLSAST